MDKDHRFRIRILENQAAPCSTQSLENGNQQEGETPYTNPFLLQFEPLDKKLTLKFGQRDTDEVQITIMANDDLIIK
jgi:hypothetical protein